MKQEPLEGITNPLLLPKSALFAQDQILRKSAPPSNLSTCEKAAAENESAIPSPFLIYPTYSPEGISQEEFDSYKGFIELVLTPLLPQYLIKTPPEQRQAKIHSFYQELPLVFWKIPNKTPGTLSVSLICPSEQTNGVGRYLCDALAKWLAPGTFLNISSVRSLSFRLGPINTPPIFFHQALIDLRTPQQLQAVEQNREDLEKEIRLTILAVRHARQIVSATRLSLEQKKNLIEENISSYLPSDDPDKRSNLFQHVHNLWIHVSAEETIKQLQEQFSPFLEQRQRSFDRSIFDEIKHSLFIIKDSFTATRSIRHVSRLISYQYLFRKTLMRKIVHQPQERHLSLKLIKNQISSEKGEKRQTLGIFGAMNLIRDNELFEEKHLLEAISHCLPSIKASPDSFIFDRKSHDPLRFFYIEIEKQSAKPFTLEEIQLLKKNLPREIKENIESVLPPLLMQRNEEEVMRNILLLAEQLKFVGDLPQVIISFNGQTDTCLQFTIILLRILKGEETSLATLFAGNLSELKIEEFETKKAGLLRRRYVKEANIFKVCLDKGQFIRRDFTIDLLKARQKVSSELHKLLGGIRDFNGGILSKQQEAFQNLKSLIDNSSTNKDFLLENFFYSITPPLRQTLLAPTDLKTLFLFMQEALDADYKQEPFFLKAANQDNSLIVMAASSCDCIKERLNNLLIELKIPSTQLSCTYVTAYGIHCAGYLYQNPNPAALALFYSTLSCRLQEWHAATHVQITHS